MDQIQAQLKQQKEGHDAAVQKLDDKIQLQTDENSRLWVRARETQGPNDIWSKMMQKHPSFRNRLQAFCLDESCPLGEQGFPEAFNALRLQRNDMMHHSSWETVIEDVNAFLDSGCLTPSLQAGRPLASWILQHVDQLSMTCITSHSERVLRLQ
ncbi:hypothetical protein WJX84_009564 [Apatococcus fuscideae]|uniref:Uncharacterized protein n=1 Tax=Apatococcus fuscideae TaxID=2026836 RepID=A0AAW1TIS3_9CHLO